MKKLLLSVLLCFVMAPCVAQNENHGSVTYKERRNATGSAAITPAGYSKWRFSLDVAYSYRTGRAVPTSNRMEAHFIEGMRTGVAYGIDGHYFADGKWGFGLRLSNHSYSNSGYGLTDVVNNFYIAPSFIWRSFSKNGNGAWILGVSIGYISYNETIYVTGYSDSISRGTLGTTIDIGYDIRLGRSNTFLGFRLSLLSGTAMLDARNGEDLSAINIGTGLRF